MLPSATLLSFLFLRFYPFTFREKGRERERERNIDMRENTSIGGFSEVPQLGTKTDIQACALTWDQTSGLSVCRTTLSPLTLVRAALPSLDLFPRARGLRGPLLRLVCSVMVMLVFGFLFFLWGTCSWRPVSFLLKIFHCPAWPLGEI